MDNIKFRLYIYLSVRYNNKMGTFVIAANRLPDYLGINIQLPKEIKILFSRGFITIKKSY